MLRVGIVGLPNVGKSTLFNALTKQAAKAQNVPFTTIEPNVGVVPVPDKRLNRLSRLSQSKQTVPTTIEFVDIAGLVRGAHQGEGLGNQFLANIRQVDAIVHVTRLFDDSKIIHVDNHLNAAADIATINTELGLADLTTVDKALERYSKAAKGQDKEAVAKVAVFQKIQAHLADGGAARDLAFEEDEVDLIQELHLLTIKPTLYVANIGEDQLQDDVDQLVSQLQLPATDLVLPLSIKIEQELVELSDEERATFLQEYGLTHTGLERLIQASYQLLDLITFFTSGEQETRAWTVEAGSTAPQAAGKIHTDFEQGFIRAETVAYDDLMETGSYPAARAAGKVRDEGKQYIVKDGDIFLFKFSK